MVNIMTVKRTIETNKTAKKSTKRTVSNVNTFVLDEKAMILKIELPVEWNKAHNGLRAKNVQDVEGKEYKKLSIVDKAGNEIYLFKTTFGYEPVVKQTKISKTDLDTSKLSDEEQKMLELLMKKCLNSL